jgi:hypothetical protein
VNPDREGLDPAFFLAVLIALLAIGLPCLLIAHVVDHDAHHPRHNCVLVDGPNAPPC